ncbi:MAG: YhdH/YhfP family quinone oxidoreductase [Clostridia bacterium]|nr:YhdH/YhfP family quinone oxidoreductase [Clostridia bacterium]
MKTYKALYIEETEDGIKQSIATLNLNHLKKHETLIKVYYSSLNYKDALSATGNKGVTRKYPHTPGIDAVGIVMHSNCPDLVNRKVIVTGYDLGMNTFGGFGEYISVPTEWVVPLPESLTMAESMMYGTAGFTAALSVYKLKQEIKPNDGPILVTGGTGGVGSMAIRLLSRLGYEVHTISGKEKMYPQLENWGAKQIIGHESLLQEPYKPLMKGLYAGVIDTIGGDFLAAALRFVKMNGIVTTCGNIRGQSFNASIFPFILRGIRLQGITSASCDYETRTTLWTLLASDWKFDTLHEAVKEIQLEELPESIDLMLQGKSMGRILVKLNRPKD